MMKVDNHFKCHSVPIYQDERAGTFKALLKDKGI